MQLEKKILQKFIKEKKTLAVAESCTGGLLTHLLTNVPGASKYFLLSIIAYANKTKTKILNIPLSLIKKYGSVSEPTASAMARRVRKILNADYGLSITGIAGPSGATGHKPVGLVFIALSTKNKTLVKKFIFKGSRLSIKKQAAQTALKMLA